MTKSRGINVPRGTRQRWVEENQGRYRCQCGCGREIPLRPAHYGKPPRLLQGHGARKYQPQPPLPCACGCGEMAAPRKRYVSGHNTRGRQLSEETRQKIAVSRMGAKNPMYGKLGAENPSWKGGTMRHKSGYILEYCPAHPFAVKRYVMQHRLIAEATLREADPTSEFFVEVNDELYLPRTVDVHHDNEIKDDNRVENLIVMWKGDHTRHHLPALIAAQWREDRPLTAAEQRVLAALSSTAAGDYIQSIVATTNLSRSTVRFALERMETKGRVVRAKRRHDDGRLRVYWLLVLSA